ncbi:MFS transporter [Streptomyces solincola]|uniref:MFS transporter n=1 Tax=Streptomyces solincola TaxID=2100817 RepID=A0A2S9PWG8_9ACTN|nr:MFS transporter [Streptomyces solincola]PRH78677.1 MFS transporter [Streptomyces solincola]
MTTPHERGGDAGSAAAQSSGAPADRGAPAEFPPADRLAALRRRTTAVLAANQVLGGLGVATGIALSAVLAQEVSGTEALAGLASTATVVGTALLSVPLAALMSARGRRPGLVLGYLLAALGGGIAVVASAVGSFPLLLAGLAAFGAASSANLQSRFAAADLAEPDRRARAISTVVWATTAGAVVGPNIAAPAGRSVAGLGIPVTAGPFLWASALFLVCAVLIAVLLRPDPLLTARALASAAGAAVAKEERVDPGGGRSPWGAAGRAVRAGSRAIRRSPGARLALVTIAVCHTAMVSIMSMTPVALSHHGAGIELIGLVISGHIAGMYALSPVMGWLADRFGRLTVIGLGMGLLSLAALLAGTAGAGHGRTAAGLLLLGLGWSAGMVSGSALLTDSVPQEDRAAAQGLSDLTMNTSAAVGSVVAGVVVAHAGYGWLNAAGAALVLPLAAVAILRRPRAAR